MKIRPKNIPKFQQGSTFNLTEWINQNPEYYKWYSGIYPNAQVLQGNPLKQRNDLWNKEQLSSSHYTTDNLLRSAYNNYLYTNDYQAREEDLLHWGEAQNDFSSLSDLDFVNRYNTQAQSIRDAREAPQTYNTKGYTDSNRTFKTMFYNRSKQGTNHPLYTIGYQDDIEDIEGTSTWLRRMDRYEKPFLEDTLENLKNRIFYITRPDGTKIKVYKKLNGDIGLFSEIENLIKDPNLPPQNSNNTGKIPIDTKDKYGFDWKQLALNLERLLPGLISTGRLLGHLNSNERVFKESLAGIRPDLQQTYLTHRLVVGDEATKQAYYRRAAQGLTKAAQPFTSDADRQVAYQMEAKRIGDELRAQGDLADNAEIRRTTDESNQHQWDNTRRRTDIANYNTLAINKANADIQRLKAQREAARWTSIENYLQGIESNLRQRQLLNQQLDALLAQHLMLNDDLLNDLYVKRNQALEEALEKYNNDYSKVKSDEAFKKADKEYRQRKYELNRQYLIDTNRFNIFAKRGSKITLKQNDNLLYKTARDAVNHYEKMVALTDLSSARAKSKKIKLTPHPKGSTKKYLLGGVAPFTVYTPVTVGGERSISYQDLGLTSGKNNNNNQTNMFDIIKDLFKNVNGIQIDVNTVYSGMYDLLQRQNILGEEFSENELASIYLKQLLQLNNIKNSKELKDWALKEVTSNAAVGEFAVTADGRYIALKDGKLLEVTLEDIKNDKTINPLKNSDLLFLREYSPDMLLLKGDIYMNIVANGVGMEKIGEQIKQLLPSIKDNEEVIQGYTKHETNQIRQGLELLLEAPNGDYKFSITTKELLKQADAAFKYIYSVLPRNMKAVLDINAYSRGTTTNDILAYLITASTGYTHKMEFDAVTGKAAKDANGNSKDESGKITPAIALAMGLGDRQSFIIADKTSDGIKIDSVSLPLLDKSNNPLANATLLQIGEGAYAGQLDLGQATMGGVKLSTLGINDVLIDRGRIYSAELPIDKRALATTRILKPDLNFLRKIEKADEEIRNIGITNRDNLTPALILQINRIYLKNGLPIIYNVGTNGKPVLTSDYQRFAMLHGTATENAFEEELNFNNGVIKASDEDRIRFESMMKDVTKNDKYKLDDPTSAFGINLWGGTDLYKGIIYIPMSNSTISALASTKYKASPEQYNLIESLDQQAEFIRSKGLKIQGSIQK